MELLFSKGKHHICHPIKITFLETPVNLQFQAQAMFVVPKRQFKKAHDRNKLKRRMRESYRLNKSDFYARLKNINKKLILALIFIGKKQEDYSVIEKSVSKLLLEFK